LIDKQSFIFIIVDTEFDKMLSTLDKANLNEIQSRIR